ncbi:hypothetical protein ACIRBY_16655 [Streptomyces sp. NPDC096136]|uniref:hypothetical protein n=1 Tax=Streptomyces sp. NPDC096136 TaxID=3366076 RepID=UPI003830F86A
MAVFITEVEAGPTALIIVGSLLIVAAVMGLLIKEIGLADGTLTWGDVGDKIRESDTPEEALSLASAATLIAPAIQHDPDIRALSAAAYEEVVIGQLTAVFNRAAVRGSGPRDLGRDATVTAEGKTLGIETRFGDPAKPMSASDLRQRVQRMLGRSVDLDAVIIVSNMCEPPLSALGEARDLAQSQGKNFQYVRWTGTGDTPALQRVIQDHLQG